MTLEQLDMMINHPVDNSMPFNIIFMGYHVFDQLEHNMRELFADQLVDYELKKDKLLLQAFEYRNVFIVRSPVVPMDSVMFCNETEEQIQEQKELIGWL